jgi:hypothetical protein
MQSKKLDKYLYDNDEKTTTVISNLDMALKLYRSKPLLKKVIQDTDNAGECYANFMSHLDAAVIKLMSENFENDFYKTYICYSGLCQTNPDAFYNAILDCWKKEVEHILRTNAQSHNPVIASSKSL